MKIITYSKVGYNRPSQANWSYGIWKVDCIDTSNSYGASYTVYENFGGDSRFAAILKDAGIVAIQTTGVYPLPKCTGIRKMQNMESADFVGTIIDFVNPKL